jgi:hypothetical protein
MNGPPELKNAATVWIMDLRLLEKKNIEARVRVDWTKNRNSPLPPRERIFSFPPEISTKTTTLFRPA